MRRHPLLPADVTLRLAIALLACTLGIVSLHRPEISQARAVGAFLLGWTYAAALLGRHLLRPATPRR